MAGFGLPSAVQIDWLCSFADMPPLYEDWSQLADRTGSEIFLTPIWFDLWWKMLAGRRDLACLVAYKDGVLVGLLPFAVETIWAGPVPIRLARLAGIDPSCMIFRLPLMPEMAAGLLQTALDHLVNTAGCHAVSFTPASELSDLLVSVRTACTAVPHLALTDMAEGEHVIFDLPTSFDVFLAAISKNRRAQYRRDRRALTETYTMQSQIYCPTADEFQAFVSFHNKQWHAVGKGGNFSDWPDNAVFYPILAKKTASKPIIQFHKQFGTQGPLAEQFCLISGKTCHWRLPARTLDPEAEKLSLGKVSLLIMIEELISQGVTRIEAGRGEYDYKRAFGGKSIAVHRLIVSPATHAGRLYLRILLVWSDLLHLFYYRIWFLKLAPRWRRLTGMAARPLWRSWIRTRL